MGDVRRVRSRRWLCATPTFMLLLVVTALFLLGWNTASKSTRSRIEPNSEARPSIPPTAIPQTQTQTFSTSPPTVLMTAPPLVVVKRPLTRIRRMPNAVLDVTRGSIIGDVNLLVAATNEPLHVTLLNASRPAAFAVERNAKGHLTFKLLGSSTYLGCEVATRSCDLDRIAARSMEHFVPTLTSRGGGAFTLRPVGSDSHCLYFDGCSVGLNDCEGEVTSFKAVLQENDTEPAVDDPHLRATHAPLAVLVTTLKRTSVQSSDQRARTEFVLRHWATFAPEIIISVCVEDARDAALLRGWNIDVATDCEVYSVPGGTRSLPTYRGVFAMGEAVAARLHSPFVMFSNADIIYEKQQLTGALEGLAESTLQFPGHTKYVFASGRRHNCPLAVEALTVPNRTACELFGDDAEDYFIVSVGAFDWKAQTPARHEGPLLHGRPLRDFVRVPALVVGAIAFDNFIVAQANKRPDMVAVDATGVIDALHLNHGEIRGSHKSVFSEWNSKLAHEAGGWARGKTSQLPYSLLRDGSGRSRIHERFSWSLTCHRSHWNQDWSATDPPDAFSAPWQRAD